MQCLATECVLFPTEYTLHMLLTAQRYKFSGLTSIYRLNLVICMKFNSYLSYAVLNYDYHRLIKHMPHSLIVSLST